MPSMPSIIALGEGETDSTTWVSVVNLDRRVALLEQASNGVLPAVQGGAASLKAMQEEIQALAAEQKKTQQALADEQKKTQQAYMDFKEALAGRNQETVIEETLAGRNQEATTEEVAIKEEADKPSKEEAGQGVLVTSQEQFLFEEAYELRASVWDAALFVGQGIMGQSTSILMLFLMLTNLAFQVLFCVILLYNFLESDYDSEIVSRLQIFRGVIAHDVKRTSALWPSSLASRICEEDRTITEGGNQMQMFQDIEGYLPEGTLFDGKLMCICALFCWWLVVGRELNGCVHFVKGVMSKTRIGQPTRLVALEDGLRFDSVSVARAAFAILATVVRVGIAVTLWVVGTIWVVNTTSMTDLVLNAIALQFVLDIDELVYEVLAPNRAKAVLAKVEPLVTKDKAQHSRTYVRAFAVFAFIFLALPPMYVSGLHQVTEPVSAASSALCEGVQNFVYGLDSMGNVWVYDDMKSPDELEETFDKTDPRWLAVQEIKSGTPRTAWKYALHISDRLQGMTRQDQLNALRVMDGKDQTASIDHLNPRCDDLLTSSAAANEWRPLQASFRWYSGDSSITFCRSLLPYCDASHKMSKRAKMLCPRTCGCHDPTSFSWLNDCPSSCENIRNDFSKSMTTCFDRTIANESSWLLQFKQSSGTKGDKFGTEFERLGCQAFAGNFNNSVMDFMALNQVARPVASSDHCAGTGEWDGMTPLATTCPSSCGCWVPSSAALPPYCPAACLECRNVFAQEPVYYSFAVDEMSRARSDGFFMELAFPTVESCRSYMSPLQEMYNQYRNELNNNRTISGDPDVAGTLCAVAAPYKSCLHSLARRCLSASKASPMAQVLSDMQKIVAFRLLRKTWTVCDPVPKHVDCHSGTLRTCLNLDLQLRDLLRQRCAIDVDSRLSDSSAIRRRRSTGGRRMQGEPEFEDLDANSDQQITLEELRAAFSNMPDGPPDAELVEMFQASDTNQDGVIDRTEYSAMGGGGPDDDTSFETLDTGGDGKIDWVEFDTFASGQPNSPSDADIARVFSGIDKNQDGAIDRTELAAMGGGGYRTWADNVDRKREEEVQQSQCNPDAICPALRAAQTCSQPFLDFCVEKGASGENDCTNETRGHGQSAVTRLECTGKFYAFQSVAGPWELASRRALQAKLQPGEFSSPLMPGDYDGEQMLQSLWRAKRLLREKGVFCDS